MARAPELTGETITAGDPYELVIWIDDMTVSGKTFAAQGRVKEGASGDPAVTFTVVAVDGTGGEAGNVNVTLSLTGTQTRSLLTSLPAGLLHCDLEYRVSSIPRTLLRWSIQVFKDVTR
jgi:hypothetical protein